MATCPTVREPTENINKSKCWETFKGRAKGDSLEWQTG